MPPPPPPSMKRHILVYCGTHKKDEHVDCAVINIQENIYFTVRGLLISHLTVLFCKKVQKFLISK